MTDRMTVAVLGAATATLHDMQLLRTTIDNCEDAPNFFHHLKMDIHLDIKAMTSIFHDIIKACPSDSSQIIASAEVKAAIDDCRKICTEFRDLLASWKWHAIEIGTSWPDEWRVSLSGQEKIRAFRGQVNLCKDVLSVAFSTAGLITKFRHQEEIMSEIKQMMLRQNETILQKEIDRTNNGETVPKIEVAPPQISVNESNWQSREFERDRSDIVQDIQRQQAFTNTFRRVCEQALAITMSERTGYQAKSAREIDSTHSLNTSIDTSTADPSMNYEISAIITDNNEGFDMPGLSQEAQQCYETLGILDSASLNNQQTHGPAGLDFSSRSTNIDFLLEGTERPSMVNVENSQSDLSQTPQDLITAITSQSTHCSKSQSEGKEKPVCWEHDCRGRIFSSWSNLRRHQREKAQQEPACYCPRCGAYFTRTSGRDQHLANMSCTRIRRYSNGRIRPSFLKIQEALGTPL